MRRDETITSQTDIFSFQVTADGIFLRNIPISQNTLHRSLKIVSCPSKNHKRKRLPSGKPLLQRTQTKKNYVNSEERHTIGEFHFNRMAQWYEKEMDMARPI